MNWLTSRKGIIVVSVVLALLTVGGILWYIFVWSEKLAERAVTINFDSSLTSVKVIGDIWECGKNAECDPTFVEKTLEKSGTIQLKDGIYYVTPMSDTVSDEPIKITISGDKTSFEIKPYYSDAHLSSLLPNESTTLRSVVHAAYPVSTEYVIGTGRLYKFGEWYATTLTPQETVDNPLPDVHYIILHKTDKTWRVAAQPSLYFRYSEHTDIPRDIIKSVNDGI